MKRLWRKIQTSSIVAALAICAVGGIAYAASLLATVPAEVTIVAAASVKAVSVYSDAACTVPITKVYWGSERRAGDVIPQIVYVKNMGNQNVAVTAQANPSISTWGTLAGPNPPINLTPGQSSVATLTLIINGTPMLGTQSFNIEFYEP